MSERFGVVMYSARGLMTHPLVCEKGDNAEDRMRDETVSAQNLPLALCIIWPATKTHLDTRNGMLCRIACKVQTRHPLRLRT